MSFRVFFVRIGHRFLKGCGMASSAGEEWICHSNEAAAGHGHLQPLVGCSEITTCVQSTKATVFFLPIVEAQPLAVVDLI